jgi:hypothetical protein
MPSLANHYDSALFTRSFSRQSYIACSSLVVAKQSSLWQWHRLKAPINRRLMSFARLVVGSGAMVKRALYGPVYTIFAIVLSIPLLVW